MMCNSLGSVLITILMLALGSDSDGTLLCGFAGGFSIVIFHLGDKPRHHFVQKLPRALLRAITTPATLFPEPRPLPGATRKYHFPVAPMDESEFEADALFDPGWSSTSAKSNTRPLKQ
jgi:hypothetical protein